MTTNDPRELYAAMGVLAPGRPRPKTIAEALRRLDQANSHLIRTAGLLDEIRESSEEWRYQAGVEKRKAELWRGRCGKLSAALRDVNRFFRLLARSLPVNLDMVLEAAGVDPETMEVADE